MRYRTKCVLGLLASVGLAAAATAWEASRHFHVDAIYWLTAGTLGLSICGVIVFGLEAIQ